MIKTLAPFPQIFSNALLVEQHDATLVRITQNLGGRGRKQLLLVSQIGHEGASAVRRVTRADLISAEPLSEAEEAALRALERELAGKARPDARKLARHEELRHRHNHAQREAERARRAAERDRYEAYRNGGRAVLA